MKNLKWMISIIVFVAGISAHAEDPVVKAKKEANKVDTTTEVIDTTPVKADGRTKFEKKSRLRKPFLRKAAPTPGGPIDNSRDTGLGGTVPIGPATGTEEKGH